jgi:hypothetical protein
MYKDSTFISSTWVLKLNIINHFNILLSSVLHEYHNGSTHPYCRFAASRLGFGSAFKLCKTTSSFYADITNETNRRFSNEMLALLLTTPALLTPLHPAQTLCSTGSTSRPPRHSICPSSRTVQLLPLRARP